MSNLDTVIAGINTLNAEEVSAVVEAVKLRRNFISMQMKRSFSIGDTVSFTGRRGVKVTGTVTKKAIKNITVDTAQGKWKVPASMLVAA
jgi:hypothetical protein|tara:strand:+ start:1610 stop:1876 length:267 start_codon:yes stop_codon:yes gene_type:complete